MRDLKEEKFLQVPLHIVVVDDEELVRQVIEDLLIGEGHTVQACSSGKEAIEYLSRNRADVLFADLAMPEMRGVKLIEEILHRKLLPIIAVTGLSFESPDVHWVTGRHIFVLFKPFDGASLRWALSTLLTEA